MGGGAAVLQGTQGTPPARCPPTGDGDRAERSARKESGKRSWIAGGIAGSIGCAIGYPLDTLKVRVQTGRVGGAQGFGGVWQRVRTDGALSIWQGVTIPIVSRLFLKSINYSSYGWMNGQWQKRTGVKKLEVWQYAASAGCAGLIASFVQTPVDFFKVRLQTTPKNLPLSGRCRFVYHSLPAEGSKLAIFYRGYPPMLCREVAGFAVYFTVFESLQRRYRFRGHALPTFFAGSFSGCVSWCLQFPFDVIKSRMQATADLTSSSLDTYRALVRSDGHRALYRGLSAALLRASLTHGTAMLTYELMLDMLNDNDLVT
eukprot:TRINITY_DN12511_c1_g1_i1.p1 TRINITY_DN12511_c1_g1~~TRINITY_DN12511_c1_g1_i1.p1  ORF type:complete len:315 (+),score=83.30 TRINITY_DN12511_c1_g1_i1:93-1037(+)